MSHPMWVRGLKPDVPQPKEVERRVAPHVGAWIETRLLLTMRFHLSVAPHVGAWIETDISLLNRLSDLSHPMWVRGLKQCGACNQCG